MTPSAFTLHFDTLSETLATLIVSAIQRNEPDAAKLYVIHLARLWAGRMVQNG